jgi:HlyD family secretion protein
MDNLNPEAIPQAPKKLFFSSFLRFFRTRKKTTILIIVLLAGSIGWYAYAQKNSAAGETRYVLAAVSKGSAITTVTGSGQVSGENQIDVKPEVSAPLVKYLVKQGDQVKAGTPIAQLDPTDGQKGVRDAQQSVHDARLSVDSAKLALQKLQEPADASSLLQAQHAVAQAQRNLDTLMAGADKNSIASAQADLQINQNNVKMSSDGVTPQIVRDAYDDAVSALKTSIQTLQDSLQSCDAVLAVDNQQANLAFKNLFLDQRLLSEATTAYSSTKEKYLPLKAETDQMSTFGADVASIDAALQDAIAALNAAQEMGRDTYDLTLSMIPSSSYTATNISSLSNTVQSIQSDAISKASEVVSVQRAITDAHTTYQTSVLNLQKTQATLDTLLSEPKPEDVATDKETLAEAQAALVKLQAGSDTYDVKSAQQVIQQKLSSLTQAQSNLGDAQKTLSEYTVLMPFDGLIANLPLKPGDQASNSIAVATIVSSDMIATITLNEVDVVNVKVGQNATLTFDAVPDLTIAGKVAEINSIGTTSQGVVSYTVKIDFQTQDTRIKPGMSVSASVITASHVDVLTVPNGAIHTTNGASTVSVLKGVPAEGLALTEGVTSQTAPETVQVETGLVDSSNTEITSGLSEGDAIVVKTTAASSKTKAVGSTTQSSSSLLRGVSGGFSGPPPGQ